MPPGYRVELVASEPLVQEPVAMDWDARGRLWVVEMPGFMADLAGTTEHDPIGRVVVLEDRDGDGRMDRRTVFADRLVLARSIKVLDRGVLVAEPPNVWLMSDTDGDLRMDAKTLVSDRYGRFEVDPQNNANGFDWSLDNHLYSAGQANVHLRFGRAGLETVNTVPRGEWGVTHDDAGRVYRNTNESALHVDLVPTYYFARHPTLVRTRGSYERLAALDEDLNVVWPVRPNPGTNRAYQAGIDRPDGTLIKFTSVCAPLVYRGDRLPRELYGNVFVAEPAANLVSRLVLKDEAAGLTAHKAYERGEFLASTDERFRPVFLANAPDGTLYIADMYRGIIEHRISITEYLRDQILERRLDRGTGFGRIYRVMHSGTSRDRTTWAAEPPAATLVRTLSHASGWWRDTAQRTLVERQDTSAAKDLVAIAAGGDWRTRLHALWTLDGLGALDPALVRSALSDERPEVRSHALRMAERWLGNPDDALSGAVRARLRDGDRSVRQQLAASAGAAPPGLRDEILTALLSSPGGDSVVVDAAISSLRGSELAMLRRLMRDDSEARTAGEALTLLAATAVRSGREEEISGLASALGAAATPEWQRSALLEGFEVALLGARPPGALGRGAPRPPAAAAPPPVPCPTCPGGRAGPGGAYAFPRPPDWPASPPRSGADLRVSREPADLTSLARRPDVIGQRARNVLARIVWPGKPGAAAFVPLTAPEQDRFTRGRDIYRNLCQGCHQPDGRGIDRIAPSLVGSTLVLAAADVPARVLLHGKEGAVGLMPPIGAALSDGDVAAVLTFVRREWGHTASAVSPELITGVRAATRTRTRPWRHDELEALIGSAPGLRQ